MDVEMWSYADITKKTEEEIHNRLHNPQAARGAFQLWYSLTCGCREQTASDVKRLSLLVELDLDVNLLCDRK